MTDHETSALRAEVAALANSMCDVRTTLNRLQSCYDDNATFLMERLAGQTLRRINTLFLGAYQEILALDESFKD